MAEGARDGRAWTGLPVGTTVGHVHLQVGNIAEAEAFYCDGLGFDIMTKDTTVLFIAAGGYHHHLGLNTGYSLGCGGPPGDTARMSSFGLLMPTPSALSEVAERVGSAGIASRRVGDALVIDDPWGNTVEIRVG